MLACTNLTHYPLPFSNNQDFKLSKLYAYRRKIIVQKVCYKRNNSQNVVLCLMNLLLLYEYACQMSRKKYEKVNF